MEKVPASNGTGAGAMLSIDKLRLKTLLGRGGFAAVWLGEYAGQEVAVKVNLPAGAGGTVPIVPQEVTDMFLREAEVTASLSHRHIIRCLGTLQLPSDFPLPGLDRQGQGQGLDKRRLEPSAAMVLELCEPTSAKHLVIRAITTGRAKAYSTAQALRWCLQVAEALAYLHRQKPCIIHRDVKQENILFRKAEDGSGTQLDAKLADLGLHVAIEMDRKVMLRRRSVTAGSSLSSIAAAGNGNSDGTAATNNTLISGVVASGVLPSRGPSANGGGGGGGTGTGTGTPASATPSVGTKTGTSASQLVGGRISSVGAAPGGGASTTVSASPFLTISPGATPAHSRTPSASALGPRPGSSSAAAAPPPAPAGFGASSSKKLVTNESHQHTPPPLPLPPQEKQQQQRQGKHDDQAVTSEEGLPMSPWAPGLGLPPDTLAGTAAEWEGATAAAGTAQTTQLAVSGSKEPTSHAGVNSTKHGSNQAGVPAGTQAAAAVARATSMEGAVVAAGEGAEVDVITTFTSCTPATSVGVEDVELLAATAEARRPGSAAASPSGGGSSSHVVAACRPTSGKQPSSPPDLVALPGGASLLPAGGGALPAPDPGGGAGGGGSAHESGPAGEHRAAGDRGANGRMPPPAQTQSPLRSPLLTPAGPTALVITEEAGDAAGPDGSCGASAFATQAAAAVAAAAAGTVEGGATGNTSTTADAPAEASDARCSPAAAGAIPAEAAGAAVAALTRGRSGSLQQPMAAALLKSRSLKQRASGGVPAGPPAGEDSAAAAALATPFASAVPVVTPPGSEGGAAPTEQRPLPLHTSESLGTMLARQPSLVTPVDSGAARSGLRAMRSLLRQLGKRELRPLRRGDLEWVYGLTGRAGSCMYMAPEVWNRVPYNEKVDVFSFGVVLYELLARDLLLLSHFNTSRAAQLGIKSPADYVNLVSKGYRPPRPVRLASDAAWDLITACWHDDPVQRPDMGTVAARLQELIRHEVSGGRSWRRDTGKRGEAAEEEAGLPAGGGGNGRKLSSDGCRCIIS